MKVEPLEITVKQLTSGYVDKNDDGVFGYDGKLDIRPPYQREFIYDEKQRNLVINTVQKGFPLNVMYWAVREDGTYEVIDGQQRTISISQYVNGDFAYLDRYYHNLQTDEKEKIDNYKLMVYLCTGTDTERLEWFRTINIAGKPLTDQELRNAVFSGPWVSDAKRYFSKNGNPATAIAGDYLTGSANRQDYLETAIRWICPGTIDMYMAQHQHDPNANELWLYFKGVIDWVKVVFPVYRKEMKGVEWGKLYNQYKAVAYDHVKLEQQISVLMQDVDVTNKKGIYPYVLTGEERNLNIRAFDSNMKREAYERQAGICPKCGKHFLIGEMEGDHIVPWHSGGKTIAENCQMLCIDCNRLKSGK